MTVTLDFFPKDAKLALGAHSFFFFLHRPFTAQQLVYAFPSLILKTPSIL